MLEVIHVNVIKIFKLFTVIYLVLKREKNFILLCALTYGMFVLVFIAGH